MSLVLPFLEYLVVHEVSLHMLKSYLSALKALFVVHNLSPAVFDHQQIKYYIKAIKVTIPVSDTTILMKLVATAIQLEIRGVGLVSIPMI